MEHFLKQVFYPYYLGCYCIDVTGQPHYNAFFGVHETGSVINDFVCLFELMLIVSHQQLRSCQDVAFHFMGLLPKMRTS